MNTVGKAVLGAALLSTMTIFCIGEASSESAVKMMKFHQSAPDLSTLDTGQVGRSPGDIVAFAATVKGENGLTAMINGYDVIMDVAGETEKFEDRFTYVVVDFGDNSTMVVAGRSTFSPTSPEIANNSPQVRAIIGGTGRFIGAQGQVTTVRNPDGSYDHIVELLE